MTYCYFSKDRIGYNMVIVLFMQQHVMLLMCFIYFIRLTTSNNICLTHQISASSPVVNPNCGDSRSLI